MRTALLAAVLALAVTPAVARPTTGQCRDHAGKLVACGPAATTDIEGVPLHARAAMARVVQTAAPAGALAQCNDGSYAKGKNRGSACRRQGGVARWLR